MQIRTNKAVFKDSQLPMDMDLGLFPGQVSPNSKKTICMLPLPEVVNDASCHFVGLGVGSISV